jgi:hypothetical protein
MEKIIKSKNTQRSIMYIDDVEFAHTKVQKWWKSNLLFIKGDEEFAVLTKDSFWKWNFSLMKDNQPVMGIKTKFWKGYSEITTAGGESWKVIKKGASDNRLSVTNAEGIEVLVLEKQGKWWKNNPYKVVVEEKERLPIQDDAFPLYLVAAMGLLSRRGVWIIFAVMIFNAFTNS